MASFEEHVERARNNLAFLSDVCKNSEGYEDWKITILYYVVVHLVNAHLAVKGNLHYTTHIEIQKAINFANPTSLCKLPKDIYSHYELITLLSRRARYMLQLADKSKAAYLTTKHLQKAINHTDKLMEYFSKTYGIDDFPVITMNLEGLTVKRYFN